MGSILFCLPSFISFVHFSHKNLKDLLLRRLRGLSNLRIRCHNLHFDQKIRTDLSAVVELQRAFHSKKATEIIVSSILNFFIY